MTKRELNRDVKKLYDEYYHNSFKAPNEYFEWIETEGKPELIRLYNADTSLSSLTADNLRKLLRLNLRLRAIALHLFGIDIEF